MSFLLKLVRDLKSVREDYAESLAFTAQMLPDDPEIAGRYRDEFLRFTAREAQVVLWQIIAKPIPPGRTENDRSIAARLFLHGAARGYWKPSATGVQLARQRCGTAASRLEDQSAELVKRSYDRRLPKLHRLLAVEQILLGFEAGLWGIPAKWKSYPPLKDFAS